MQLTKTDRLKYRIILDSQWLPLKLYQPAQHEACIVSKKKQVLPDAEYIDDCFWDSDYNKITGVIAWMPLPSPIDQRGPVTTRKKNKQHGKL